MTTYDVVVAGLGGFGSATAAHLASRGLRVLGLDRHAPGHVEGSSHGDSRIVRQAYFEGAAYGPLLRRAYELWDRLGRDAGEPLLVRCGVLFVGDPAGPVLTGSLDAVRRWDVPHELLGAEDVTRRFPVLGAVDGTVALFEPDAGLVSPERTVAAHLTLAGRAGADLRHREQVTTWEATGAGVRVVTGRDTYRAGALVLAPGRWAPELLDGMHLPLRVERRVMHWYDVAEPGRGDPDAMPAWVWDHPGGVTPYAAPDVGRGLKLGVHRSSHRPADAWTAEELAGLVAPLLPGLAGRASASAPCWYTLTPDEHFVVGRHPAYDRVFLACGFSGHGFKFTPVIGEALADLVADGTTSLPLDLFDPARFAS